MTPYEIIVPIATALVGGGIGSYFTFRLGGRKQDESEFSTLIHEYKTLLIEQKETFRVYKKETDIKLEKLSEKVEILTKASLAKDKEILELRNQLMIFESSHADVPVPLWLKDSNGIMLFLNSEYEKAILNPLGKTMEDYIGNTDVDVWGQKVGRAFFRNDLEVIKKRKPVEFIETWQGIDCIYEGRVLKYPRFLGKTVIGIGGIILDINVKCPEENKNVK